LFWINLLKKLDDSMYSLAWVWIAINGWMLGGGGEIAQGVIYPAQHSVCQDKSGTAECEHLMRTVLGEPCCPPGRSHRFGSPWHTIFMVTPEPL
jgi:hypothetical protein